MRLSLKEKLSPSVASQTSAKVEALGEVQAKSPGSHDFGVCIFFAFFGASNGTLCIASVPV